jgi:hypothetical protein
VLLPAQTQNDRTAAEAETEAALAAAQSEDDLVEATEGSSNSAKT